MSTKFDTYIGIDPGRKGAMAVLNGDGSLRAFYEAASAEELGAMAIEPVLAEAALRGMVLAAMERPLAYPGLTPIEMAQEAQAVPGVDSVSRIRRVGSIPGLPHPDMHQNALMKLWEKLPKFKGESEFATWAFTVSRNAALSELRAAMRRTQAADTGIPLEELMAGQGLLSQDDPVRALECQDAVRQVIKAMKRVTPKERELLLAMHEDGTVSGEALQLTKAGQTKTRRPLDEAKASARRVLAE